MYILIKRYKHFLDIGFSLISIIVIVGALLLWGDQQ